MRIFLKVLVCITIFTSNVCAAEYKDAVVKGVQKGKFVFEVNGQELQVSPGSTAWKAFDINGRQLTEFGHNFRVMKPGNVVNVITATKRGTEYVEEIHLVKGELAEVGKAKVEVGKPKTATGGKDAPAAGKRPSQEQVTYSGAIIKSIDGNKVVLLVGNKEIEVVASGTMKAFDLGGSKLSGKGQNMRVLKEGNQVDVTIFKGNRDVQVIREIHLVKGNLLEK
jgi:hypothetical protein